ncbi:unnamed protein product [Macrosiphum euphorbiae]|uniref:Uncharacterized protein n=1 Tax=Macrosiphum euphorbiae TaxID=13131 RepID=A0AAV0XYN3_9HEMI|nr:unnamed protein product [Macrosiphum euphorbiae]
MVAAHGSDRHSKKTVNIPDYCKNSRYDTTLTCPTSTKSSVAGSAPSPSSAVGSLQRNYSFYNHRLDQLFFFLCNRQRLAARSNLVVGPATPSGEANVPVFIRQINDAMMG